MRIEQERFFEAFALLNGATKPEDVATKLLEAAGREFDFAAVTSYDADKEEHKFFDLY